MAKRIGAGPAQSALETKPVFKLIPRCNQISISGLLSDWKMLTPLFARTFKHLLTSQQAGQGTTADQGVRRKFIRHGIRSAIRSELRRMSAQYRWRCRSQLEGIA